MKTAGSGRKRQHFYDLINISPMGGCWLWTGKLNKERRPRVWTGEKALELGLIDELGDLQDAIASAATLAGISDYKVNYRRKPLSVVEQVMMEISGNVHAAVSVMGLHSWLPVSLQRQVESVIKPLQILDTLTDPNHIYLYCDSCPL